MADFIKQDLSDARFEEVDFHRAWFRNVCFVGAKLHGVWLEDVEIDGLLRNVRVNGVEIGPLVEAELDRRYPQRAKLRPTDAAGFREAWPLIEEAWAASVARARRLPPAALHERVDDEWSFIETLRHLVFATDAWVKRAVLGEAQPYSPLGLPHTEHEPHPAVPDDHDARPELDEILAVRADRMSTMRTVLATLTDQQLASEVTITLPGYPDPGGYPLQRCLGAVVHEEWEHHLIAERDLATLEARLGD